MKKKTIRRLICCILSFLMLFEPAILPALRAEEADTGEVQEELEPADLFEKAANDELATPKELLDLYFEEQNASDENKVKERAWANWGSILLCAYTSLDEGAVDALTVYDAISTIKDKAELPVSFAETCRSIPEKLTFAINVWNKIIDKIIPAARSNAASKSMKILAKLTSAKAKMESVLNAENTALPAIMQKFNKATTTLTYCGLPTINGEGNQSTKAFWRWITRKQNDPTLNVPEAEKLTTAQGAMRIAGIALSVAGLILSAYSYFSDSDFSDGRIFSYNMVKKSIDVGLCALGIAATLLSVVFPPLAIISTVATIVIALVEAILDTIGDLHKRWKEAYFASHWFLYENDEDYTSFFDSCNDDFKNFLDKNEISDTYFKIKEKYADDCEGLDENSSDAEEARNAKIYKVLKKQSILTTYYAMQEYELNNFDIDYLETLWDAKQNYMAYKPTEAEAEEAKNDKWYNKLGKAINPKNWIKSWKDSSASKDFERISKDKNLKKVYFNPDYILIKKFRDYITSKGEEADTEFYRSVGLRIEVSPFNYLPLLSIENWEDDVFCEALLCDSFLAGQKELSQLESMIDAEADQTKDSVKSLNKVIKTVKKHVEAKYDVKWGIGGKKYLKEIFRDFVDSLQSSPDEKNEELYYYFKEEYGVKDGELEKDEQTPRNIVEKYADEIKLTLLCEPLALGNDAMQMITCLDYAKQMKDKNAIMEDFYNRRKTDFDSFDEQFKRDVFKKYLKEGSFLSHEKSGFLDWLSADYSSYDETKKYLDRFRKAREKFSDKIDDLKIDEFAEWVQKINNELQEWKGIVEDFGSLSSEFGINVILCEKPELSENVFAEFKLPYSSDNSVNPLDASEEVSDDVDGLLGEITDNGN